MQCSRCRRRAPATMTATLPEGWVARVRGGDAEYLCEFCAAAERAMRGKEGAMSALAREGSECQTSECRE